MSMDGRVWVPRRPGSSEMFPFTAVPGFATPVGTPGQSIGTRTWETDPAGWYWFTGHSGRYTVGFAGSGRCLRPTLVTNQTFEPDEALTRHVIPKCDYWMLEPAAWDPAPASGYYQTFVAAGTSITHVGFKLAHDGVDGEGPGVQNLVVSVHRVTSDRPGSWPQTGPAAVVADVSAGGSLDIVYAAGWHSGEVPTERGKMYALRLRAERSTGVFQAFWRKQTGAGLTCYREAGGEIRATGHELWLYIAGDSDGLRVPCNKRSRKTFSSLTQWGPKWAQTYVAQGHSLAMVVLYAAVADSQPPLHEQRIRVRVRQGGPDGPTVGLSKLAAGQPTDTAFGGVFGACFAPGEVNLQPGRSYAVEFEAFIPGQGFNPIRRPPADPYEEGRAFFNGSEPRDYDLDMLIAEYERTAVSWDQAVLPKNLLRNGDMEQGAHVNGRPGDGGPDAWRRFAIDPNTSFWYVEDSGPPSNRYATVIGGGVNGKTVDGGYVQAAEGLSRAETYRLSARLRCSWPVDNRHQCLVGLDPTGQTSDARAATIRWAVLPFVYGVFEDYTSPPLRPVGKSISVWLRARTTYAKGLPFQADFDDVALRQVHVGAPGGGGGSRGTMSASRPLTSQPGS